MSYRHNENHRGENFHNEKNDDGDVKMSDVYHESDFYLYKNAFVFCYCFQEMDFCAYFQNDGEKP